MNELLPIIRRKRRPLLEAAAEADGSAKLAVVAVPKAEPVQAVGPKAVQPVVVKQPEEPAQAEVEKPIQPVMADKASEGAPLPKRIIRKVPLKPNA